MRKMSVVLVAGALLFAACGDSGGDGDPLASGDGGKTSETGKTGMPGMDHGGNATSSCSPSGTSLAVAASGTSPDEFRFDKDCLAAPAGQAFTVAFDNKSAGVTHNVVILRSHTDTGQPLFRAPLVQGAKVETLNVPGLEAGTYAFHCEVHPSRMSGSFVVK